MQFIGQEANLDIINKWNTLPNFMIIQGDAHTGKSYFVLYLCHKFKLHYVAMKNSVSTVRNLINDMVPNNNTVYHFKDFHTASIEAKNALLKITEEPIPGNYIIITGGPQIKTLESRATRLIMSPYSKNENCKCLQAYFEDIAVQNKIIESGIDTPAKIEYYREYEKLEALIDFAYEIANKITFISPESIAVIMSRFENRYDNVDIVLLFLNIVVHLIENKMKTDTKFSYKGIFEILLQGKKSLIRQPTLKRKMLLYKIFYQIYILDKENLNNEKFKGFKTRNNR